MAVPNDWLTSSRMAAQTSSGNSSRSKIEREQIDVVLRILGNSLGVGGQVRPRPFRNLDAQVARPVVDLLEGGEVGVRDVAEVQYAVENREGAAAEFFTTGLVNLGLGRLFEQRGEIREVLQLAARRTGQLQGPGECVRPVAERKELVPTGVNGRQ